MLEDHERQASEKAESKAPEAEQPEQPRVPLAPANPKPDFQKLREAQTLVREMDYPTKLALLAYLADALREYRPEEPPKKPHITLEEFRNAAKGAWGASPDEVKRNVESIRE